MKRILYSMLFAVTALFLMATTAVEAQAGLGLGLHYRETVEEIGDSDGFDSDSLGYLGVFSFGPALLNFELDVEYIPNYINEEDLVQTSIYAFIGHNIYAGMGTGISYYDGEWYDDPFFDIRAGLKFMIFDVFASYRFQKLDEVGDLESDDLNSVTFGALLKF